MWTSGELSGLRRFACHAGEVEDERCYLERHFFALGNAPHWLALEKVESVIPRVQFDAAAQRQRNDLIGVRLVLGVRCHGRPDKYRSAQTRADEVWNLPGTLLQFRDKHSRGPELVFIRRVLQYLGGFRARSGVLFPAARKIKVLKSFLLIETNQAIVERVPCVCFSVKHDVAQFLGDDRGEAGLVRQNVDQASAQNDGAT